MKTLLTLPILGVLLWAAVQASEKDQPPTETTAGWVKYAKNPVLGGDLGTCFDISVLKEGDTYRMWFSWRPKKSIALVESKDGIEWSKPVDRPWPQRQDRLGERSQPPGRHQERRPLSDVVYGAGTRQVVDWLCHQQRREGVET